MLTLIRKHKQTDIVILRLMKQREEVIENYVRAYNTFDVPGMTADFHADIVFENIQNGEVTLSLEGISAFIEQAESAKSFFSSRRQTIKSFKHHGDETEIYIDYHAVLAIDFPNGLKKGEELNLQGRSVFTFYGNKIVKLTDIS